jgi:N-acetylglucosaminyl-diphospho-decaprenol L-rhamnosyltransferase
MAGGRVDVVIVTANSREMTSACVAELEHEPLIARIVVVDNGSNDGTAEALHDRFGDRVDLVVLDRAHGFAAANNRGVERGDAPYVCFLNSDILTTEGAIATLLRALEGDPGAVAAGGRLVDPETLETQREYRPRPFPGLLNFAVILLGIEELWPGNPITRRYHGGVSEDLTTRAIVAQPAAAALLVARSELAALGGFDERFWFWFEDADLARRLSERGRILYVPTAVFRHLGGATFLRWSKPDRIRSVYHGIIHYGDAQFPGWQRRALGLIVLAMSLPRIAVFRRSRPDAVRAWRAVATAGRALVAGRPAPAIAPDQRSTLERPTPARANAGTARCRRRR